MIPMPVAHTAIVRSSFDERRAYEDNGMHCEVFNAAMPLKFTAHAVIVRL